MNLHTQPVTKGLVRQGGVRIIPDGRLAPHADDFLMHHPCL